MKEKIDGVSRNVPVWLPKKLKELGLIRSEFTAPSIKTLRAEVMTKALDGAIAGINHPYTQNIPAQLEGEFSERIVAYTKLMELSRLNQDHASRIRLFIKRMACNELF